ncbi:MAG: TonB-dependent receptor [Gemmatimonadales bacterium]
MRSVVLFVALIAAGLGSAHAQDVPRTHGEVRGVVVDATNGEPVAVAQVQLAPLHQADMTRADGRFILQQIEPGTYTLSVERLGYEGASESVTVLAGEATEVRVELRVAALQLSGIIVSTGALSSRSADDVLSPVTTIAGADLDRRSNQTLAAMLDGRPGLTSTSLGPSTARPIIRGLGGDRILVLEDGQRTGDMSAMSSDHAVASEPLTARQIEVVRGPMSLMYGSSALGGVVNVVREDIPNTSAQERHGMVSLEGATVNDGLTGGGYLMWGLGAVALRGEGSGRNYANLRTPDGRVANTGGRTWDLSLGMGLPGEHAHGGASYRYYGNEYGIPGGFVGGHATGVDISMRRHALHVQSELHRDEGLVSSVGLDGGFTHYTHTEFEPSGAVGTDFQQDLVQGELVARHSPLGIVREGAVGLHGQYRDIRTGGSLRTPSTWDYSLAGFLVEELGPEVLRFQLGLRVDHARYEPRDTSSFVTAGGERVPVRPRSFGAVSGSAGLLWTATEFVKVGASVSRAYRTPDFNELYSNGPHLAANSYDVGDPALGQETGMGLDVFVRLTHERIRAEVAAYRNMLSDYVFPSSRGRAELGTQGGRPRFQYTNEDARFVGVEGEVLYALTRSLRLEGSGSVVRATFTSDRAPIPEFDGVDTTFVAASKYPPLIPPAQGRVGIRLDQPGRFAGIGVKLVAKQGRLGDFETTTDGYALFDANAGLRIVRGDMLHTITLRVDNVFDTSYRDHLSRIKDIMPGAGRSLSVLYRMVF